MARAWTRNCAFVRNGSIDVVQSKLRGWHFSCDVGLIRQLPDQNYIIGFGSEGREEGD